MYRELEKENQTLKNQIKGLTDEKNNLEITVKTFVDSREKIQTEISGLKVQNRELTSQVKYLRTQKGDVSELKRENRTLNNLVDNLKNEIQSFKRVYVEKTIKFNVDYTKLTVIVPYRRTQDEKREENLDINLNYLSSIGISNILISEHSDVSYKEFLEDKYSHLFKSFKVTWTDAKGDLFNLAAAVNNGVLETETPYFAMADSDCLTKKKNIDLAIELLDQGFDVVHPFNRRVTDIVEKPKFIENYDFNTVNSVEQDRPWADGGMVFWNKYSFISMGMKNEYFIGWGGEDNETTLRSNLLKCNHYRIDDTLYHLYHKRSLVRTQNNVEQLENTKKMDKKTCLEEINKWPWVNEAKRKFYPEDPL